MFKNDYLLDFINVEQLGFRHQDIDDFKDLLNKADEN